MEPCYVDRRSGNFFTRFSHEKEVAFQKGLSSDLVWALTKRNNKNLVKFNGNTWTRDPFSINGFHNASNSANTLAVKNK